MPAGHADQPGLVSQGGEGVWAGLKRSRGRVQIAPRGRRSLALNCGGENGDPAAQAVCVSMLVSRTRSKPIAVYVTNSWFFAWAAWPVIPPSAEGSRRADEE